MWMMLKCLKTKKLFFHLIILFKEKKDKGRNSSLIERLFYHDAYLIYQSTN